MRYGKCKMSKAKKRHPAVTFVSRAIATNRNELMKDDLPDAFIPPPPVRPGFDRDNVVVVSDHEYWGHIGRPSKMKQPLPEDWRPARPLTSEDEERLVDMRLWARAHGVEMADWNAFWEGS